MPKLKTKTRNLKTDIHTDEGRDYKKDVQSQSGAGIGEEVSNRRDGDDGGEQLDANDRVNLANEGPPELGALQHHRVQRPRFFLHVGLRPHLRFAVVWLPRLFAGKRGKGCSNTEEVG